MNDDNMYTWESSEREEILHSQEEDYWCSYIGKEICGGGLGCVASTELKAQKLSLVFHQFSRKLLAQGKTAALYS